MNTPYTRWRRWMWLPAVVLMVFASGCGQETKTVKGFILPEGDIEKGKATFVELGCRQCHSVAGVDLPPYDGVVSLQIEIGGKVLRVKNYGELMTSIVYPDHQLAPEYLKLLNEEEKKRGNSPMPDFRDTMTVKQLIDLAAFLHSRYEKLHPQYTGYYGP